MKTNKRTVWFLTLLSLVAVISIYTLKEKAATPFDGITIFGDAIKLSEKNPEGKKDGEKTPVSFAVAANFEEMRMEVRNQRGKLKEQLTTKINSGDYTAVQKNSAYEEMALLDKQDTEEALMELQIKSLGYPEAFVRTEKDIVKITVLSTEGQSKAQADEIIHYVRTSWADAQKVQVDFSDGL